MFLFIEYILLSDPMSLIEFQSIDAKWLITALIALGIFIIEIWTRIYKPYKEAEITRKRNQINQLKEEKGSLDRLVEELYNCISNLENSLTYHGANQIRLTNLTYPSKFVKKIDNYNTFAGILHDMSQGCEYYANLLVTKNVLAHLADINVAPNEKIHSMWDLGSRNDNSRTCLAPDQSFLNLPQNVFRPEKLNNMKIILIH